MCNLMTNLKKLTLKTQRRFDLVGQTPVKSPVKCRNDTGWISSVLKQDLGFYQYIF